MSFLRHRKIYQSDEPKGGRTGCSASLATIVPMSLQPAIPSWVALQQSPCPLRRSFAASSLKPAAVQSSAAKRQLPPFSLSQHKGPLQAKQPPSVPRGLCMRSMNASQHGWLLSIKRKCLLLAVFLGSHLRAGFLRNQAAIGRLFQQLGKLR
jgi:hypothetical protein